MPFFAEHERWRAVRGYRGLYSVSSFGRVKSKYGKGKYLRLLKNKDGYLCVNLYKKGTKMKRVFVHKLVLEAFVSSCPPGMECRHFPDRSRTNNKLENLSWVFHEINLNDKSIKVHDTETYGQRHGMAKLTNRQAREIVSLKGKVLARILALRFQVHIGTIWNIWQGNNWSAITGVK